ncbi:MAG: gliding motility-associated C-terminal domain-containing protein [Bacteroidetes bacterium]|nr:gliding motility-associated C-terminal domain-containing protein [Bacteroidota bacterium]
MRRFIFCLLLALPVHVFGALQMKCISVGAAGAVSLNWANTSSALLFRSYHVFHSVSSAGPFSLVDSVNVYASQNYVHPSANANALNAFYYVELNNTNGSTEISDTVRAMRLNVIDPGDGYASLIWNTTHTPQIATNSNYHLVYREYPAGIFTLIDSVDVTVSTLNYLDEISICGDTVKYRIEVSDASGCKSISSVDGDFFTDRIAPVAPHIDSVSVDALGNAVIGWSQSPSNDTYAYIVYQTDGNTATPIDTVYGIASTFYASLFNATVGSQGFRIVALDTCGNPCGAEPLQQTIFLQGVIDPCSESIQLTWNAYVNSPGAPLYKILYNQNGGSDVVAGLTASTFFTVDNLKTDSTYCFKVMAELSGINATSTSNIICVTPDLPVAPQYSYIRSVSVFPNDVVSVTAYVDPLADVKEYHLQRANSETGNFVTVRSQPFAGLSEIIFTDDVSTDRTRYYRVAAIDSCGNDALNSQISKTIVTDSGSSENYLNLFSWSSYQFWPGGVSQYAIYRSVDGISDPSPYKILSASDSTYSDDVRELISTEGNFCYFIVAYEAPGNPYGFADSARSNEICFKGKSGVFIPNAFHPGGVNSVFNPSEYFIGLEGYSLEIFNRFGEVVFETKHPDEGWDGTVKGHHSEMGVFVYRFKARDEKGYDIEKVGSVTLIR